MIWYLILLLIIVSPFAIYFIIKALQAHFDKSKDYAYEAILVKKTVLNIEEIEKDLMFFEEISSTKETEFKLSFMLKDSNIIEFNVLEEDFNRYNKDSKGILHYKKCFGIPTFMYFDIR